MKYNCRICGESHMYYLGTRAGVSRALAAIRMQDSTRVFEPQPDYFLVDKKKAVFPAVIEISTNLEDDFWYETWVECPSKDFLRLSKTFNNDIGAVLEGRLFDDLLPFYQNTKGLRCEIMFRKNMTDADRARIHVLDESELRADQLNGLDHQRLEILMNKLYHSANG